MTRIGVVVAVLLAIAAPALAQPTAIDRWTPPLESPRARAIARGVSDVSVAASLALETWHAWRDDGWRGVGLEGVRVGAVVAGAEISKRLIKRWRPDRSDRLSMPSEHTAIACTAAGHAGGLELALCALTGGGRVAGGRHFLTDTLVGAAAGLAAGRGIR